ncbi:MAG: hypothetical protein FJY85_00770 [Deltaproteobacteria bacterium]|nr:hypothetical protein [Deltaproteobacteria bacterium]
MKPGDLVTVVPADLTEVKISQVRAQAEPSYSRSPVLRASWIEEMVREALQREYVNIDAYSGKPAVVMSVDAGGFALVLVEGELVHTHTRNLQAHLDIEFVA